MTAFLPRRALPVATLLAAAFFLVSAVPHALLPAVAVAWPATFDVVQAEIQDCEARGDRHADECIDEVEGKALIRHAEEVAQLGARADVTRQDEFDDLLVAPVPRSRPRRSGTR